MSRACSCTARSSYQTELAAITKLLALFKAGVWARFPNQGKNKDGDLNRQENDREGHAYAFAPALPLLAPAK